MYWCGSMSSKLNTRKHKYVVESISMTPIG